MKMQPPFLCEGLSAPKLHSLLDRVSRRAKPRSICFFLAVTCSFVMPALTLCSTAIAAEPGWIPLTYSADTKGLLPWAGESSGFPHSMEWLYIKLNEVMKGPAQFDRAVLHQTIPGWLTLGNVRSD